MGRVSPWASPRTCARRLPVLRCASQHARLHCVDPDLPVRVAAIEHVLILARRYDDVIPRSELLRNLKFAGERYALLNPQAGIHRPAGFAGPRVDDRDGRADGTPAPALCGRLRRRDRHDLLSYRQGPVDSPDNRALGAAFAQQVPLIYLVGVAPAAYALAAPVYIVEDRPAERSVLAQIGSRATDLTPAAFAQTLTSAATRCS
jgi:putative restriction endonuclease